ncbi:hypothetical protein OC861_003157, partial [Tilletia horrida]
MPCIQVTESSIPPPIQENKKGVESMLSSTALYGSRLASMEENAIEQRQRDRPYAEAAIGHDYTRQFEAVRIAKPDLDEQRQAPPISYATTD